MLNLNVDKHGRSGPVRHGASAVLASMAAVCIAATGTGVSMSAGGDRLPLPEPVSDDDFYDSGRPPQAEIELGRMLFFDKILSGNRNIACATCHHPNLASSDAVSLALGEGASGLGRDRAAGSGQPVLGRVPRNAQALFNLGAREFTWMYNDGRVEQDVDGAWHSGFSTPAREQLPPGLDSVLAAQAMFPVQSPVEMAGHKGENEIADAVSVDRLGGPDGVWDLLAGRLRAVPGYVAMFQAAFPDVSRPEHVTFVHAANAIAAFEAVAFRADDSPFDTYLRTGNGDVLGASARRGMQLFYGRSGCSDCHAGKFQTDQRFHAIAMPQIGPGKGDGADSSYFEATGFPVRLEDRGRYRVTADPADLYRFRTPSLRNVELTGPWGHDGAFASLEAVVRHHADPVGSLAAYDPSQAILPKPEAVIEASAVGATLRFAAVNPARLGDYRKRDTWLHANAKLRDALARANELPSRRMKDAEVIDLVAFLKALTDPTSRRLDYLVPATVPSGLPVAD